MALATGTLFEVKASATTANVNGAGFNPGNANFLTNGTVDTNTGNTAAPVFSSATYNFVAGDVGAYIYVKSGTNTIPGMYIIASVASNKATLNATAGQAEILDANTNFWTPSTATGIATVGTPTSITFGVDYSRLDSAKTTAADGTSTASTTFTSATAAFTPVMVGNFLHINSGTGATIGWYEIVTYVSATQITLDRASGTMTLGNFNVGGAGRFNALEDAFLEMVPAGSMIYFKGSGTHTVSATVAIASSNSTAVSPSWLVGYTSYRGDTPTGTARPTIASGANSFTFGQYQRVANFIFTTTATIGIRFGVGCDATNCKAINSSSTAGRFGFSAASATDATFMNCEAIAQNGDAINVSSSTGVKILGCYVHDSVNGINLTGSARGTVIDTISEAHTTAGFTSDSTTAGNYLLNNTFYGREAKIGIGINYNANGSINNRAYNNILYGLTTGVIVLTTQENSNNGAFNNYFNNTTDATLYYKDRTDLAVDPQFVGATQLTGTTATTSGSTLTQSGGDFSTVEDNIDFLHVISGTGVTVANYLITSHTSTTVVVNNALGTSSAGDVVYFITTGHNFAIGTNLKAAGYPGVFNSNSTTTTGYKDIGAAQRQESGSSGMLFIPCLQGT